MPSSSQALFLILLTVGFSSIVSSITALILKISLTELFNITSLIIILLLTCYNLTLLSFDIFVSFKYDVKLARTISIIIILITLVIFIGLANLLENLAFINNPLNFILIFLFGLFIIGFFIFYYLTIQTVKKKDF